MSALGILSDARRTPRTFGKSCPRPNNFQALRQCCTAACKEPLLLSRMSVRQVVRANTCSDSRLCVGESRSLGYEEALAKLRSF